VGGAAAPAGGSGSVTVPSSPKIGLAAVPDRTIIGGVTGSRDAQTLLEYGHLVLVESRGEVKAGSGDPEGALADWRRALELDPNCISGLYSSAFLLERGGRMAEAVAAWRSILAWNEARDFPDDTDWPRRQLARLTAAPGP